jgi:hypothetical protein
MASLGEVTLEQLVADKRKVYAFITAARKANSEHAGHAKSLDQPDAYGRTLHDRLAADEPEEELEDA